MDNRQHTCCFTGHRTVAKRHFQAAAEGILDHILSLSRRGITDFIAGGALGFDTLAALAVLKAKETEPAIRLILAIPCLNQTEKWNDLPDAIEHLKTYKVIMGMADEVIYTSERTYFDGCMKLRNQYMVDHASLLITVHDGQSGGTRRTIEYAMRRGLDIVDISPER